MEILQKEWTSKRYSMTCGSYEAEIRKYKKFIGKTGLIWLVADQEDAASNIYVEGGPGSEGFGGRTLTFELVTGEKLSLKGPWHSNADSFFQDTGYDIRDKYFTFVVIGLNRKCGEHGETIIKDILYIDPKPLLGLYQRGYEMAQKLADELQRPIMLYSEGSGGSSSGFRYPKGKTWADFKDTEYFKKEA